MWMIRCSGGTEDGSAQVYHRDVDGGVAPMYRWCMPVGVGRPGEVHINIIWLRDLTVMWL